MNRNDSYPFYHYVVDDKTMPFHINAHTHGLDKYDHLEFECVLPYTAKDMEQIFNILVYLVARKGNHFEEGCYTNILTDNYRLYFVEIPDHFDETKNILRLIYPDDDGRMPWEEGCEEHYALQILGLPAEKIFACKEMEPIDAKR